MGKTKTIDFLKRFRIETGRGFRLKDFDPADTHGFNSKKKAEDRLARDLERLDELQQKLYAQDRWALLIVLQALDAAGKDGTIQHVMSGVNPEGCDVVSFKTPTPEELDHDYLWRTTLRLPERGRIGIFNRSYYEDVLILRVHPELLETNKLPPALISRKIWKERYEDINAYERHLARNGTVILKFFLHLSREEQLKRFLARLDQPQKNWKFSLADVHERNYWKKYQKAYEDAIRSTATRRAPWYIVPADHKWFARLVVAAAIVEQLEALNLAYPVVDKDKRRELAAAKEELLGESDRAVK
ncbi:MAG: polyphosphate kinase 2 family protein [Candidatus Acidiferrales bacterium]